MKFHFNRPLKFAIGCFAVSLAITVTEMPNPDVMVMVFDGLINGMGWGALIADCLATKSTTSITKGE